MTNTLSRELRSQLVSDDGMSLQSSRLMEEAAIRIDDLEAEVTRLKERNNELSWQTNPERMGR